MKYEAVIGLEIHAQLLTDTKIFCGCKSAYGDEPNTNTCPVCLGMPGALPVLNEKVVEYALRAATALKCEINRENIFARKNYFYPDLPKGYQISEFDKPLAENGLIEFELDENTLKSVKITRIHIEEDAGKNLHEGFDDSDRFSYVDMNRCGIPLIEIVSEPDIRSSGEASGYLQEIRKILRYIGACDGNMEEGSLRCDANLSLRPEGAEKYGTRTEVKNMNSFRSVRNAIEYEIERQTKILEKGEAVILETRLWNQTEGKTVSMRTKEESHDYRYFPEPDLVPLYIEKKEADDIKKNLPELPKDRKYRFIKEYSIPWYNANILTESRSLAEYFENCCKHGGSPLTISNWIISELLRELKNDKINVKECKITPESMSELIKLIEDDTISGKIGKSVFMDAYETGKNPREIIDAKGLTQITDESLILDFINQAFEANESQLKAYLGGKDALFGFFFGQIMKLTKGKANPQIVNKLLKEELAKRKQ